MSWRDDEGKARVSDRDGMIVIRFARRNASRSSSCTRLCVHTSESMSERETWIVCSASAGGSVSGSAARTWRGAGPPSS